MSDGNRVTRLRQAELTFWNFVVRRLNPTISCAHRATKVAKNVSQTQIRSRSGHEWLEQFCLVRSVRACRLYPMERGVSLLIDSKHVAEDNPLTEQRDNRTGL